ncbi:MAG: SixA phosphatase family protein [Panacagrimonas sp.]
MLRLTLVRHAKSSWDDTALNDFERPLNPRGRRDAPVMAQRFARLNRPPDRLVSSPALRAISTARTFAEVLGMDEAQIELVSAIYEATPATLLGAIRRLDASLRHVMLFGHNPGFSELACLLAPCPFDEMPTCAVVSLELEVGAWTDASAGCGRLASYLYPKDGAD